MISFLEYIMILILIVAVIACGVFIGVRAAIQYVFPRLSIRFIEQLIDDEEDDDVDSQC